jgi:hypothetical protein
MTIELVELNHQFVVPCDGDYLVRRTSNIPHINPEYFKCRVKRHLDTKRNIWTNTFDCHGVDRITHISTKPLQ